MKEGAVPILVKMDYVYIVIENGDPYPLAYKKYEDAVASVKTRHKESLLRELQWIQENDHPGCNEVDVPESESGLSRLYIEKGIHIEIHKLPILGTFR
uniref:Uncharacterized protein n=1 Tax=viral metagenome TaxID=1070528 RepID=A0A6C0BD33_9ZZZZ